RSSRAHSRGGSPRRIHRHRDRVTHGLHQQGHLRGIRKGLISPGAVPLSELNPKLNADRSVIVMLETAEGIENCEAVAEVDGIDVLLIGSGDLTTDLPTSSGRSNRRQQHGSVEAWAFCEIRGFIGSRRLMPTGPLALFNSQ